jgi:hypothetical protein
MLATQADSPESGQLLTDEKIRHAILNLQK